MTIPANNSPAAQASPCELCGSDLMRSLFDTRDRLRLSEDRFHIVECEQCGVMRTLPEMSEAELAKFYPRDYWGGEPTQEWIRSSQADKTAFVHSCNLAGGRVLDVGCGAGFFLRALEQDRWQAYGIEIGEEAAAAAATIFGDDRVFRGTLLDSPVEDAFFDLVTFWSSLEHTNEPRANLRVARRALKPGGTLIVQVPNAASYQAGFFKGDWFSLDAPRHRYHFSMQSLQNVLHETGFELYLSSFHSKVHNTHALRQSLKARLWSRSIATRGVFLLAIPFLKPFDLLMSSLDKGATLTVAARAV